MKINFKIAAILIVLFWLGTWILSLYFLDNWQERGQFGDLFGSINSLFSGLAFLGLVYTIVLQREDLSLQREELKLQREEMVASRAELAHQVQTTIGQIRASAIMMRVEGIKMRSEANVPGARKEFVKEIDDAAAVVEDIAKKLELKE